MANAGVAAQEIGYVEAHGTGTPLGDPIEFDSLKAVLAPGRSSDETCWIGSVKTNIGHLEAAAGIAGVIKTVLAFQHQEIPPHLHLKEINPHLDIGDAPLSIPTEPMPWPGKQRLAGVSSFGMSGTNVHVVLEAAPVIGDESPVTESERPCHLLTLSAKNEEALRELAGSYATWLDAHPETPLADVCFTANTGRSHFEHRLALVADSPEKAREQLHAASYIVGTAARERPRIASLFTGQGSQYGGMGRQLYETEPLFRRTLDECDAILRPLDVPLLDLLYPKAKEPDTGSPDRTLDRTVYTQPALFALEYALARLWQSWGLIPDAVMGHSVGEYAAACIAGVFGLEDGLKLIAARGRLMQTRCETGEMQALPVGEGEAHELIAPFAEEASIAAINGPASVVISGTHRAMEELAATLAASGIKAKPLPVSHAFHSGLMGPMLAKFREAASAIIYAEPTILLCSNVTGELATEEITTPGYWVRHVRQPVRFAASIKTLYDQGFATFLEIGPRPALLGMARQCLPDGSASTRITWLPSLREGQPDWRVLLQSLGTWYTQGGAVDWAAIDKGYSRRKVSLPTYPFQRCRCWVDEGRDEKKAASLPLGDSSFAGAIGGEHAPGMPAPSPAWGQPATATPNPYLMGNQDSPSATDDLLADFEAVTLREPAGVEAGWVAVTVPPAFGRNDLTPLIEQLATMRQTIVLRRSEGSEHFCLGMDLGASGSDAVALSDVLEQFQRLGQCIRSRPMPVICVVAGACRGGGMLFPSLATTVLATEDASFGFPDIRRGRLPGLVSVAARQRLSEAQCRHYILTGDRFDANTAKAMGFVDFIGSASEVEKELKRLLGRFNTIAPELLAAGKQGMPSATEETALLAMGGFGRRETARKHTSEPLVEIKHQPDTGVLVITLNDPLHSNAMSPDIADDLRRAIAAAKAMGDSVRALVFQGNGKHFCTGANSYSLVPYIKGLPILTAGHVMYEIYRAFVGIRELGAPVVCALHGKVVDGGFAAMLNADYRIAAQSTIFNYGNLPRGTCPGMLLSNNPERMTGLHRALDLYLNDYTLTAEQARQSGLVHEVVPDAAAAKKRALQMAAWLAGFPSMGVKATLDLMRPPLDEARLARECVGLARCITQGNAFDSGWQIPARYMDDTLLAGMASPSDTYPAGGVSIPGSPVSMTPTRNHQVATPQYFPPGTNVGRPANRSRNVGIHAMELYFPNFMVHQSDMEKRDGVEGKYTVGLLQEAITFCGDDEDAVSMAMTVVLRLMKRHRIGWDRIGRLEVGTESLVDRSKSIKTHLMELFESHGQCDIEGVDTYTACYGGTAALFNTVAWCQSDAWDGRFGIVIAVDIADLSEKYAFLNGAGAVAMLIGPDAPVVMLPERGSHMIHNWDFYKPVGWKESFPIMPDGQHTVEVYMDCLTGCQKALTARLGGMNLLRHDDYFAFHSTGSYLAKRGFERLARNVEPDLSREELQALYQQKVYPGTLLTRQLGSTYTASVYIALYSLFLHRFDAIAGKTICVYSYGGGSASSLYRLRVMRPPVINRAIPEQLERRVRLDSQQYPALADRYSSAYGRFDFVPDDRGDRQADTFYLERVDEWGRRFYTDVSQVEANFLPEQPSASVEFAGESKEMLSESDGSPASVSSDFVEELKRVSPEKQRDHLSIHIQSELNKLLGFGPGESIDFHKGFFDLGMDSLMVVELGDRLKTSLGCALPSTLLFKYPTLEALLDHILREVLGLDSAPKPAVGNPPMVDEAD